MLRFESLASLIVAVSALASLAFIAYQNVILARMLAELTALVARTH